MTRLKFTPPKEDEKKVPRYASYGAGQMRLHSEIGHAKLSLSHRCSPYRWDKEQKWKEAFLLELYKGEWYVLYHVEDGTAPNELPWMKKVWVRHERYGTTVLHEEPTYRPEEYHVEYRSYPMTRDEYADWRVRVELERLGIYDAIEEGE